MSRREQLLEKLAMATRHVQMSERAIARAREIRDGHDVAGAGQLLASLEELQKMHLGNLERIRQELKGTSQPHA